VYTVYFLLPSHLILEFHPVLLYMKKLRTVNIVMAIDLSKQQKWHIDVTTTALLCDDRGESMDCRYS